MNKLSKTIINDEYLAKCEEGEPIFALCGRDMHASGAVRYWAIAKMQKHGKDDPQANDAAAGQVSGSFGDLGATKVG